MAGSQASGQGGQQRQGKAARQPHLSGRLFTDNLLLEQSAVSKSYCAALCAQTDSCAAFTYTTVTSQRGVCRGHSTWMTSNSPNFRSEGTVVYSFVETAGNSSPNFPYSFFFVIFKRERESVCVCVGVGVGVGVCVFARTCVRI